MCSDFSLLNVLLSNGNGNRDVWNNGNGNVNSKSFAHTYNVE